MSSSLPEHHISKTLPSAGKLANQKPTQSLLCFTAKSLGSTASEQPKLFPIEWVTHKDPRNCASRGNNRHLTKLQERSQESHSIQHQANTHGQVNCSYSFPSLCDYQLPIPPPHWESHGTQSSTPGRSPFTPLDHLPVSNVTHHTSQYCQVSRCRAQELIYNLTY